MNELETLPPHDRRKRGYAICLLSVILWSTTGILIRYLLENYPIGPLTLAFWRNLFASGVLALVLGVFRPRALFVARRSYWFLLAFGLSLAVMNISWTVSVALNGAAVSTILIYASPGITAIVSRFLLKEPLSATAILAIGMSFVGCALVAGVSDWANVNLTGPGIICGAISALGFTAYSVLGKLAFRRGIYSWSATLYAFCVATIILLLAQTREPMFSLQYHVAGWLLLLCLAVIPTLGGFGLFTASLEYLPAGHASLMATLEPVLTTILAFILLHEALTTTQLVGGVLIVGSVMALEWSDTHEEVPNTELVNSPSSSAVWRQS